MQKKFYEAFKPSSPHTPKAVSILLLCMLILTLSWLFLETLFPNFAFGYASQALGLTSFGFSHGFIWQLFLYGLVQKSLEGFTLSFLFYLLIRFYLFWLSTTAICLLKGTKKFLTLFFFSMVLGGLLASIVNYVSFAPFAYMDITGPLYACLVAWMMLHPQAKIFLFFQLPLQASSIILGALGLHLLFKLSAGDYVSFFCYLGCSLASYFYTVFFWGCKGPISKFHHFENSLTVLKHRLFSRRK